MRIRACLLLVLLLSCGDCIWAQQYPLYRYSVEEGLAHANVYRITQDKKGFLWFSTNFGLSRFDGKHFVNYHSDDGLGSNMIMSMSEDEHGNKWISTFGSGLSVLDSKGRFSHATFNDKLPKNILFSEEWHGARWVIGVDTARNLFCVQNSAVSRVLIPGRNGHSLLFYKMVKAGDAIYFLTDNGIYQSDKEFRLSLFLPELIKGKVTDLQPAANGELWIGKEGEIMHIMEGKLLESFSLQGDEVTDMQLDRNGRLWISAADQGIVVIENHELRNISSKVSIGNVLINDIFEDNEGNIWFATHGEGASRLNSLDFVRYGIEKHLMNAYCKALAPYRNDVYIGSFGNVSVWQNGLLHPVPIPAIKHHVFIYFIHVIGDQLYIGTPYGLIRKQIGNDSGTVLNPKEAPAGSISMCTDKRGKIWLGSYSALYWLNGNHPEKVKEGNPPLVRINALLADKQERLWLGTENGIYVRENRTEFRQVPTENIGAVSAIFEDTTSGDIWFASDNTLAVYRGDKLITLTNEQPKRQEKFNTICSDVQGNIWVGSVNGLQRVDPKSLTVHDYKTDLGEVLSIYCAGEHMFLGTVNGLSVIRPSGVDDKLAPVVYITSVFTDSGFIAFPQQLQLAYNSNKLRIEFAGVHFRFPKSIDYRYRIEGLDSNWHFTENTNVEIPALPSGAFRFVVAARKNGGPWGKAALLDIAVATPFWRKVWVVAFALCLLFLFGYILIRTIVRRAESKKRRQLLLFNKMLYLKQQALGALINPHFIFNAMNSIQHYLNRNDTIKANKYLADFAGLIRVTLQHAQDAFIPLDTEIARLQLYLSLEQLRTGPDLQYEVEVADNLRRAKCYIPNMVLQPYVENAIWHGIIPKDAPGILRIQFYMEAPGTIAVQIIDDGVGYSEEAAKFKTLKQKSLGMALTAERLELFQKLLDKTYKVAVEAIINNAGEPGGTSVTITLPYLATVEEWLTLEQQYAE